MSVLLQARVKYPIVLAVGVDTKYMGKSSGEIRQTFVPRTSADAYLSAHCYIYLKGAALPQIKLTDTDRSIDLRSKFCLKEG
jgi:hypothetical protein